MHMVVASGVGAVVVVVLALAHVAVVVATSDDDIYTTTTTSVLPARNAKCVCAPTITTTRTITVETVGTIVTM